jgi:hypothetical protein
LARTPIRRVKQRGNRPTGAHFRCHGRESDL